MMPDEICAALETAKRPPAEALRAAATSAAALTPAVLAVVDKAAAGMLLTPRQSRLMFYGLHALAAAREQALYAPLLRLLRRPHAELDRWFGDALEVSLGRVALSVFDGDAAPLIAAIEDRRADGIVRWQLFEVLARLAFDGAVPRETALALIDRFERDRLAEDGNHAWIGWAAAIALLGLAGHGQRVRVAWSDRRVPLQDVDLRDWEEALARAVAAPADPSRFVDDDLTPIDDPVAALAWVDAAAEGPGDDSRPNDPAAAHALDAEEIDWLAEFLARGPAAATAMSLEEMDGFVTALICGPAPIDPLDRLDHILGATNDHPVPIDEEQNSFLRKLLTRHKTAIAARLAAAHRHDPLIAAEEEDGKLGRAWARGFLRGVFQDGDAWEPLARDERFHIFLGAVMALDSSRSTEADRTQTPADRRKLVDALPTAILGIHGFWREHSAAAAQPREQPSTRPQPRRPTPPLRPRGKVGRNDPCPCGSGKKFKRCCALLSPTAS